MQHKPESAGSQRQSWAECSSFLHVPPGWDFALRRLCVAAASLRWPARAPPKIPVIGKSRCAGIVKGDTLKVWLYSTQGVFTRPQIIQMDGALHGGAQVSRTSFCESFHRITHHYFLHRLHAYSCDRFLSDVSL